MSRMAPHTRRSKPNLRMLRLLIVVLVLVAVILGVRQLSCSGDSSPSPDDSSAPTTTGENGGGTVVTVGENGSEVEVTVGRPFAVGGMTVVITTLGETGTPTGARYPIDDGRGHVAGAGESFYQAFARAENSGDTPMRVDPLHFFLDAGGALLSVDPTHTGPGARSLIRGASFDFIVTFLGPAGLDPRLVYRPPGGGTVIIQGVRQPEGVKGTTTATVGAVADPAQVRAPGAA
ncbi:MAG: hypothetical protein ACYC5Q_10955 [Thermoleophilia bacterium]